MVPAPVVVQEQHEWSIVGAVDAVEVDVVSVSQKQTLAAVLLGFPEKMWILRYLCFLHLKIKRIYIVDQAPQVELRICICPLGRQENTVSKEKVRGASYPPQVEITSELHLWSTWSSGRLTSK